MGVECRTSVGGVVGEVSVDWRSLRNVTECSCSTPFHAASRKVRREARGRVMLLLIVYRYVLIYGYTYIYIFRNRS